MSAISTFATRGVIPSDEVAALGTILGVWAHPDDEAYLSAGLMAMAIDAGSRVACVSATRGEAGGPASSAAARRRIAQVRTRELAASLAALGVDEHTWLDAPDGGCTSIPVTIGSSYVSAAIDAVRPDTIVTFGPDGLTGHPDHIAVSRWVDAAVAQTAAGVRVLHATMTVTWAERFAMLNEQTGVFGDVGAPTTPDDEVFLRVDLSPGLLDRKMTALRAQASQTAGLIAAVGEATYRAWWATEWFVEASAS